MPDHKWSSLPLPLNAPITRRVLLTTFAALGSTYILPTRRALAEENSNQFEQAYKLRLGDRVVSRTLVKLEMPELAENGNMVPFTVAVDSPMTDADHVTSIALLSTGNPQAVIATFKLTPASGRATISGRLRLARSQDVIALAQFNTGALHSGQANVKVTVGGCGAS